jgi:hypothetical protein
MIDAHSHLLAVLLAILFILIGTPDWRQKGRDENLIVSAQSLNAATREA